MQYPKMLYKGNQEEYQTAIADDEDHEAELVADNWVEYSDLPEQSENQHIGEAYSIDSAALVPVEQFDALALKVTELEQENAELSKKLRIKELEDTSSDDLKALLTERNVQFGARDSKAVLLNLVIESDGGE
jgi:thioesterase domain-containing protein